MMKNSFVPSAYSRHNPSSSEDLSYIDEISTWAPDPAKPAATPAKPREGAIIAGQLIGSAISATPSIISMFQKKKGKGKKAAAPVYVPPVEDDSGSSTTLLVAGGIGLLVLVGGAFVFMHQPAQSQVA